MLTTCMLMTCIRTDQSTLDASVSHRFEVNALIGENITELNNRSSSLLKEAACKPAFFSINRRENTIASRTPYWHIISIHWYVLESIWKSKLHTESINLLLWPLEARSKKELISIVSHVKMSNFTKSTCIYPGSPS